jgi:hypothetical protein
MTTTPQISAKGIDIDKLKALALAFESAPDSESQLAALAEFNVAANPAAVLALITEVERMKEASEHFTHGFQALEDRHKSLQAEVDRLRTELAAGAARQGGDTSDSTVAQEVAKTGAKIPETRMDSGFDGGARCAAPAAGTDRDAARLRNALERLLERFLIVYREPANGAVPHEVTIARAAIAAHSKAGEPT